MIKILVVDDEDLIRKGLIKVLGRAGDEFEVIGGAANGVEALELIKTNVPDIVVTDVKMPFMDGLELVNSLETNHPGIRKVILSGYSEYNYVRDAMKHGAADYLLKPVDEEEFTGLLRKLASEIRREEEKRLSELNLRIKLDQSLPLLREEFIRSLVTGKAFREGELSERLEYFNMKVQPGSLCVIITSIDNYRYITEEFGVEEAKLKAFVIRNIAEETIARHTSFFSFMDGGSLACAVSIPEGGVVLPEGGAVLPGGEAALPESEAAIPESGAALLRSLTDELFSNLAGFSGTRFTMSVGRPVEGMQRLGESWLDAEGRLKYRFYREKSSIVTQSEALAFSKGEFNSEMFSSCIEKFSSRLKNCIEIANPKPVAEIINEYCTMFREMKLNPSDALKSLTENFIKLQMSVPEFDKSVAEVLGSDYSFMKALDLYDTLDEIRKYLIGVLEKSIKNLGEMRRKKDKKTVEIIKDFIQKHYSEDITLNKIVEVTYLSSCYVCDLFKNQTGENIIDFLTRVRIEKAKALLKDVKIKTYEVGRLVGYEDATYFSKVFKKVVGVSPSEYRNMVE